jgi:imidazolonepropionase
MRELVLTGARLGYDALAPGCSGAEDGCAIAIGGGAIVWAGPDADLPRDYSDWPRHDVEGRLVTPALIDCHTHIVHGGNRAREFEMRLEGASYEELARAGGGIVSTVRATREASEEALLADALRRVDVLIGEGVAAIEIKSGYGLDIETELKMLRVARRIGQERSIRVRTSFLGAHAVPPEYKHRPDAYIDEICIPALDAAHQAGLADAVDGFCEGIAFTPDQIERVFRRAAEIGLPVKLHAEQLSNLGGAKLAAQYGALSADHLEYLDEAGVDAMAAAGTVAVLLPGAFYTLRETQSPPVALLRKHGVPIAIATDCNPGSSPLNSILLTMNMACTLFRLTPEEALFGVTKHAARALGLDDCGVIAPGMRADLVIWDIEEPAELAYRIGFNPLHERIFGGVS